MKSRHRVERGHAITYEQRSTLCGKPGCAKLHGPYWYAYWSDGGKVRTVYIGREFRTVEEKCPERLRGREPTGRRGVARRTPQQRRN